MAKTGYSFESLVNAFTTFINRKDNPHEVDYQQSGAAPKAGDASQTFDVSEPTESTHATPRSYVDAIRIVGEIIPFGLESPPDGFFHLDGSTVPGGVDDFQALAESGSPFITISGDDIILADNPDFLRGKGSSDRSVGEFQDDSYKSHSHYLGTTGVHRAEGGSDTGLFAVYDYDHSGDKTTESSGGDENRSKSLTGLFCIYHGVV